MTTPREPREPLDVQPIAERAAQATPGPHQHQLWPCSHYREAGFNYCRVCAAEGGSTRPPHDIPALLAEVARLRGLIAQAEWQAEDGSDHDASCPWCRQFAFLGRHATDCPAFSAPGVPR